MKYIYSLSKKANKLIDSMIKIILILVLLLSAYVLWDIWSIKYRTIHYGNRLEELAKLHEVNPNVVGWLVIDETNIDYPLLIGDTNDEYLYQDEFDNYSVAGSLFLDYRNDKNFTDFTTIIHGHNMSGGKMFSDILKFKDEQYFNTHTTGTLYTLKNQKSIKITILIEIDAFDYIVYSPKKESKKSKEEFLEYVGKLSVFEYDRKMTIDDNLLILSTCDFNQTNGRVVLIAQTNDIGVK